MHAMSPEVARPQPRSFPRSITLFHYRGVPVRLDWSWTIIAALLGIGFYTGLANDAEFHAGTGLTVTTAAVITLLFFASVLVHELGHAHTSLDRGVPVAGVTLFLLGGVTESTREASSARDEFVIVGAGPLLSLTLAAAFGLVWEFGPESPVYRTAALYLGGANLVLGLANLVPGFPLDGGRLLRSIIWGLTQRPHTATRWAARVGQAFALSLGAVGVLLVVSNATSAEANADGGWWNDVNGLWLLLIALFLFRGASDAYRHARLRERVAGRTASDVMGTVPDALDPALPLHHAVRSVQTKPSLLWPVGDPVTGAVRQQELDGVPRGSWSLTSLGQIAIPAADVTVASDAGMDTIMTRLQDAPGHMLLVVDEAGRAVGLLTPSLVVGTVQ